MSINCDSVGVPVTSRSVEAVDRLETATLELLGWRGDPIASLDKSIEIDPQFTMGHVARGMLDLLGTIPLSTPSTVQCISNAKSSLTDQSPTREKLHVQAMDEFYKGNLRAAASKWESILKDHPTDLLALKFAHDTYFYLGDSVNIRDSVARVFKTWKYDHSNSKAFGYVMGMYSFGLEETALYDKARQTALGALDRNPTDAWAVHTVAHVNEMLGTQREGLQFMGDTHSNWENSGGLAVHLHWHTGLYMLELGQNERAMDLYDSAIRAHKSSGVLDLVDASSFLFRCEMADIPVEDRWDSVIESWNYLLDDRILVFNDLHMMWSALGAKKPAIADKLLDSMKSFADTHKNATEGPIMSEVGIALAEAVQGWYGQNYSKVVDCLLPVRHKIVNIGGSHAQRDIFNILLVKSSMKSHQHSLAKNLLSERIELKDHSPQSWLWYADTLQALGNTSRSVEAITTAHQYLKD